MAINGRIKLDFGEVFPRGLYVWAHAEVQPARDFDRSTRENAVQATDRDTGLPVWQIDALDADDAARGKDNAVTIKILAEHCPTLPDGATGPVIPIELEDLTIGPYVERDKCKPPKKGEPHQCRGRLAYGFRATGIKAPVKPSAGRTNSGPSAGKEQAA